MQLKPLDLAIFVVYMLAVLGLGLLAARRGTRTKRDYFLAGDRLPWWMIGGSIVAANISSHQFVGSMGLAYNRGFVAMVTEVRPQVPTVATASAGIRTAVTIRKA